MPRQGWHSLCTTSSWLTLIADQLGPDGLRGSYASRTRHQGVGSMTGQPPSGTVTFLMTDLEGSTRLWEEDPEAMKAAMVRHDELLEKTIAENNGFVFARMGDGMAAAFATAGDAVRAATAFRLPVGRGEMAYAETTSRSDRTAHRRGGRRRRQLCQRAGQSLLSVDGNRPRWPDRGFGRHRTACARRTTHRVSTRRSRRASTA